MQICLAPLGLTAIFWGLLTQAYAALRPGLQDFAPLELGNHFRLEPRPCIAPLEGVRKRWFFGVSRKRFDITGKRTMWTSKGARSTNS
jgi:hypothetical protein